MTIKRSRPLKPDVRLSSGRTMTHSYIDDSYYSAQKITPSTGPRSLTESEFSEYSRLNNPEELGCLPISTDTPIGQCGQRIIDGRIL